MPPRIALFAVLLWAGCRSDASKPDERVVTLVATAEVKGTTEPCGCNSDPLGGVDRVVALARGGLLLDAGSLLYPGAAAMVGAAGTQADLKADALAKIYGGADVGLGVDDLERGPQAVRPARQAANVPGVLAAVPHVRVIEGVKIGVFGVARLPGAGDPVAAARTAVAALQHEGAQAIVALLGMSRADAREILSKVEGIGFGVVGAEVGDGMPEAEPVGTGFLVSPADQARMVARIELHVRGGQVALQPFAGEAARRLAIARAHKRVASLSMDLAKWQHDPSADKAFVAARAQELADLQAKKARLEAEKPVPPPTSYFTYELQQVRQKLPGDKAVQADLRALSRKIGERNLSAARDIAPPPGDPHYVGVAACAECHKPAVAFWKKTVHAGAWKTLVDVDKQYNYDCIGCHVTGWGRPGGSNLGSVEKQKLVDVQCEVCHGPGSKHVAADGLDEPKTMARAPANDLCANQCHTKEHSDTFQLDPYLRDILGKGHGEKRRQALGDGVTGHELRQKALAAAGRS